MKTIRAYGGVIHLWNTAPRWSWEYWRDFRNETPQTIVIAGKAWVFSRSGGHGFGDAATLRDARRRAVNALKAMA